MFDIKMEIVFRQNNNIQYTHALICQLVLEALMED